MSDAPQAVLSISGIAFGGITGEFRANSEKVGWRGTASESLVAIRGVEVEAAEWCDGTFRVLHNAQVYSFDNFQALDFDQLWNHFSRSFGIHIKKRKVAPTLSSSGMVIRIIDRLEELTDAVDSAPSESVKKMACEQDLLKAVEQSRDLFDEALAGDKQQLAEFFGSNNCELIHRLQRLLDSAKLEIYDRDQRWLHLKNIAFSIESVLKDQNAYTPWHPRPPATPCSATPRSASSHRATSPMSHSADSNPAISTAPRSSINSTVRTIGPLTVKVPVSTPSTTPGAASTLTPLTRASSVESRDQSCGPPCEQPYGPPGELPYRPPGELPYGPPSERTANFLNERTTSFPSHITVAQGFPDRRTTVPSLQYVLDKEVDYGEDPPFVGKVLAPPRSRATMYEGRQQHESNSRGLEVVRRQIAVIRDGWVWKKSKHIKRWRRRYLVLTPNTLATYKDIRDTKATELIYLDDVDYVRSRIENGAKGLFEVVTRPRVYAFVLDDAAQKAAWAAAIDAAREGTRTR
eukprot:GEMP01027230.1.p1 GENE.GEMP01027230.1~~GEMP01027230.1.p1  ORF type:complete len:519 (+),score=98.52 GEMP01027230.1:113-1669(+)